MPLPHNAFALFLLQKAFAYWGPSIPRHCHRELADSPEVLCHSLGDSVEIRSVWHQKELWGGQPLKETLTNEAYLMKLLSIRNSISKKGGGERQEASCPVWQWFVVLILAFGWNLNCRQQRSKCLDLKWNVYSITEGVCFPGLEGRTVERLEEERPQKALRSHSPDTVRETCSRVREAVSL